MFRVLYLLEIIILLVTLIDNDESFQKIMAQSSHNTFPQIFLDNKFFGGYDELSEQAKLDNLISFK